MKFLCKGLVFDSAYWKVGAIQTPTPYLMEDRIRMFVGFRDLSGISRIGFVDLSSDNPENIIGISDKFSLDIGKPGMFDDNGVNLGDLFVQNKKLYLYYVGFQLVQKAKFLAFSGMAVSEDQGICFERVQETPVLDRKPGASLFHAIHCAQKSDQGIRVWVAKGFEWEWIEGKPFPKYDIGVSDSVDGIHFSDSVKTCIPFYHPGEYRVGRPRIYYYENQYLMLMNWANRQHQQFPGFATSEDGFHWNRNDELIQVIPPANWKSEMVVSYPSLFEAAGNLWMVFVGRQFGLDGFYLAERVE